MTTNALAGKTICIDGHDVKLNYAGKNRLISDIQEEGKKELFTGKLQEKDKTFIFDGLQDIVSDKFIEKAWNMIYERYKIYENL